MKALNRIEIVKTPNGKWFTRSIARNGRTIQHSEILNKKDTALRNAELARNGNEKTPIIFV